MDVTEIRLAILAAPALQALLPDSHAIATVWPARKKIVSREVGEGLISHALGIIAGPVFIKTLNTIAASADDPNATPEQQAQKALIEQAARLIAKASLNVGMESVRAGIDGMVGVLPLTQVQADAIKALAEVDDPMTEFEVRRAIWNDDGTRAV